MTNRDATAQQDPTQITEVNIAHWDDIFASRGWGRYPPEELVRFIARTFPDREARGGQSVLEVGCGPGPNLWYLAREGFAIAGIDGSANAIRAVGDRLRTEGLNQAAKDADLRVGNFASLPWAADTFEAVIDIEAISANTTKVIDAVLGEALRVLKPGGWFFAKMFGPMTDGLDTGMMVEERTTQGPLEGPLQGMGTIHAFTEEELRKFLSAFSEIRLDWVHRSDRNGQYSIFEWLVQARK